MYALVLDLRRGERQEVIFIILPVAKGNEPLVPAAVVPLQTLMAQSVGH